MTNISLIVSIIAQLFAIACLFYVRKQYKISRENWKKILELRSRTVARLAWIKPGDTFQYDNNGKTYHAFSYPEYDRRYNTYIIEVSINDEKYRTERVFQDNKTLILIQD